MTNSCWLPRAGGDGVAGSLTPRCSATVIRCKSAAIWINTSLIQSCQNHNHHNCYDHSHGDVCLGVTEVVRASSIRGHSLVPC